MRIPYHFCLLGLIAAALFSGCATSKAPYVEAPAPNGLHLFNRPKMKSAPAQWEYVQQLQQAGHAKAAAKQAYSLRLFYGNSAEAAPAQLLYARWLDDRGDIIRAFDEYQYLLTHYSTSVDFSQIVARQMELARRAKDERLGKWLLFPGVHAPERAIPLFEKLLVSAPEGDMAAEVWFLKGQAHEAVFQYPEAISAYFTAFNRFPKSPFAEQALRAHALCNVKVAEDTPNDNRALDIARAACMIYLQHFPNSGGSEQIRAEVKRLRARQAQNAYDRAVYYDHILKQPKAAVIEYNTFVERFPESGLVVTARKRIQELGGTPPKENTP